jgi:EAL domain-containing protein (putative c-di-GMP-specific phosphodiesterase class I)
MHPSRGLLSPVNFIPIAEECGLIVELGEWVLRESLRQMKNWQALGMPNLRVSINIAAPQFHQKGFAGLLDTLLREFGIDGRLVELELTESMLVENVDAAVKTMQEIKALGISLAIDDFGTGFSSLSYLSRFPIDRLKIDQSFVRNIENTPANATIARTIVALANGLSLDIIAEGIETQSENTVLKTMRCTQGQGYLFAKPLSAEGLLSWINTQAQQEVIRVRGKARQLTGLCVVCDIVGQCCFGGKLKDIYETTCKPEVGSEFASCVECRNEPENNCAIDNANLSIHLHEQLGHCNIRRNFNMPPDLIRHDLRDADSHAEIRI